MTDPRTPGVDEVRDALQDLPELAACLPDMLVTRARPESGSRRADPGSRPPVRLDMLDLLGTKLRVRRTPIGGIMEWCDPDESGILPYLWGWCRDLEADAYDYAADAPPELPDPATVSGCCAYLLGLLDFAATRPQWREFAIGVTRTYQRVRVATRDYDGDQYVTCNRCGAGQLTRDTEQQLWTCTACGREISVQAVTLRQASPIVGVPLRTLQRWAWRHLFDGVSDEGRTLYDLGDIRRVVAESRLRAAV